MQYISPFQTLGIEAKDISPDGMKLAKKKLLAELELSDTATILRGGKEMTKDDALKAFDNLGGTSDWYFHGLVTKDKPLLDFLEKQIVSPKILYTGYTNPEFIAWLSPYVAYSFQKIQLQAFKGHQAGVLKHLWQEMPKLMDEYALEKTEIFVEQYITNHIETLEDISLKIKDFKRFSYAEIKDFYNPAFIDCLAVLPKPFQYLKDSYAVTLYNFAVYTWNTAYYSRAIDAINAASRLQLSPYEHNLVREGLAFFNSKDDWTNFLWQWEDRSVFKTNNWFTNKLSWLMWLVAIPAVGVWRLWMYVNAFLENYSLGRALSAIVRFTLGIGTFLYVLFLIFGAIYCFAYLIHGDAITDSSYSNNISVEEKSKTENNYLFLPDIMKQIDDTIAVRQKSILGDILHKDVFNGDYSKVDSSYSDIATLKKRYALYQNAWNKYVYYEELVQKHGRYVLKKQVLDPEAVRPQMVNIIVDSTTLTVYKQVISNVVSKQFSVYSVENVLIEEPKNDAARKMNFIMLGQLKVRRDSLRLADNVLQNLVK
jgi:hypothetical protein